MKRFFSMLLLIFMVVATLISCSDTSQDVSDTPAENGSWNEESTISVNPLSDFEYGFEEHETLDGETFTAAVITEYVGDSKHVVIPEKIEGKTPLLASGLFMKSDIESVVLPDSLPFVTEYVFRNCKQLKKVTLGNGLLEIKKNAFEGCTAIEEIVLPNSLKKLADGAFSDCTSLKRVVFPNHNIESGSVCFSGCAALSELVFPEGITEIGKNMFVNTPKVAEVTLPASLEVFFERTFPDTVEKITFLGNAPIVIGSEVLKEGVKVYYNPDKSGWDMSRLGRSNDLIPIGSSEPTELPEPKSDFIHKTLEDGTAIITDYVGAEKQVIIPDEIDGIKVVGIGYGAFNSLDIESVTMPETVGLVEPYAFYKCKALKSVKFSDNITSIGKRAFEKCGLEGEVVLPKKLSVIDVYPFVGCDDLHTLVFTGDILEYKSDSDSHYGNEITNLIFNSGVEQIGAIMPMFSDFRVDRVTLPSTVKTLYAGSFNYPGIKSVTFIGDAPEIIGGKAFHKDITINYDPSTSGWDREEFKSYTLIPAE